VAPEEGGFCIFDFTWNELRRAMNDPMKHLPYSPSLKNLKKEREEKIMQKRSSFSIHYIHEPAHLDQVV
jgi:hypothetical protein